MLQKTLTNLTLTDRAKQRIVADIALRTDYTPIAALFLEIDIDKTNPRWALRYLDRRQTEASDILAALIEVAGLQLVVPQMNLLEILDDMSVDWTGSEFAFKNIKTNLGGREASK